MQCAQEVLDMFRHGQSSLAVPTWFYGHEPSNLFSVHIAKYFSNSLREDGLLAIAMHGIIFAPGSAGTTQEVFQDATQNHYATYGVVSPMVFLGREHFGEHTLIYDCLSRQAEGKGYVLAADGSLQRDCEGWARALGLGPLVEDLDQRGDECCEATLAGVRRESGEQHAGARRDVDEY